MKGEGVTAMTTAENNKEYMDTELVTEVLCAGARPQ